MTGILFVTEEEAQPFLRRYARGRFDGLTEGDTASDAHALVTIVGLGKIKATLRTERLLQEHRLQRIVHTGTCSVLSEELEVGSLVGASQVLEGDRIELAAPSYPRMPLENPFDDLSDGTLVTQDHLLDGEKERSYWQRIADFTDTTGYAVAFVAAMHGVPCHIVKAITGRVGEDDDDLQKTRANAYDTLATFLIEQIEALAEEEA